LKVGDISTSKDIGKWDSSVGDSSILLTKVSRILLV
jgi:hypothetical protein